MKLRGILIAALAGLAAFIIVGVTVTEVTAEWIEFSLFVGIPAGVVAGVAVALVVYLGMSSDAPRFRRRVALGLGTFGGTFLLALIVGIILNAPTVMLLMVATAIGAIAGMLAFIRSWNPVAYFT